MGNFDDTIAKAKNMAEVLGKKSAEALELSRLKLSQAEAKNLLNKAYAQLGRVYYEALAGRPENAAQKEAALREIDRQNKAIAALERDIRAVQANRKCASCGTVNPDTAVFCTKCGNKLDK